MEINIIVKDVVKKLQRMFDISKSVERQVLENVLLVAEKGETSILATDGRFIQGKVAIGSKIVTPGATLIPVEVLKFLKAVKGATDVATLSYDSGTLTITVDTSTAEFSVQSSNQYPVFVDWGTTGATIESKSFMVAIKTLMGVAGKDEPFDNIFLGIDGSQLLMGATDNFRISFFTMDCGLSIGQRTLDLSVLPVLQALGEADHIDVGFENGSLTFRCTDYVFRVQTGIPEEAYNVLKFFDTPQGNTFDISDLINKVKAADAVLPSGDVAVRLDLKGKISAVSSRTSYEDVFECDPQEGDYLLHASHLHSALKLPYSNPVIGVKKLGHRELLHIRDKTKQVYLVPLKETK